VLWAWAAAQYPHLLTPGLTIGQAAATRPVLTATLASQAVGAVLLIPSLAWLYVLFQRTVPPSAARPAPPGARPGPSAASAE
jgi:cytochrome d ubiquinol oxidase subunit II